MGNTQILQRVPHSVHIFQMVNKETQILLCYTEENIVIIFLQIKKVYQTTNFVTTLSYANFLSEVNSMYFQSALSFKG